MLKRSFMTAVELGISQVLYDALQTVLYKMDDGQIVNYVEFNKKVVEYERAQPRGLKKLFSWFIEKPNIPLPPRYVLDMGYWYIPGKYLGSMTSVSRKVCEKHLIGAGCIYGLARAFSGGILPENFREPENVCDSVAASRLSDLFLGTTNRHAPVAYAARALRSYLETGKAV